MLKWSTLSKVGNSKVFKTSFIWLFIVPLIAKLFYHIETISFTLNEKAYTLDLTLSFSFQMLFFSAVFATIGQILYTIFAPSIISNYNSYTEYKEKGKGQKQLKIEYKQLLEKIIFSNFDKKAKNLKNTLEDFNKDFKDGYVGPKLSDEIINLEMKSNDEILYLESLIKRQSFSFIDDVKIDLPKESEVFWYIRDEIENINQVVKYFITIAYIFSFVILGLIAIENIYYVVTQSNLEIFQYIKDILLKNN